MSSNPQSTGDVFRAKLEDQDKQDTSLADKAYHAYTARRQRQKQTKGRLVLLALSFCFVYGGIAFKLAHVAQEADGKKIQIARKGAVVMKRRPDIVDRNGEIIAKDIKMASLFADPRKVKDAERAIDRVSTVLPGLNRDRLVRRLKKEGARFAWIKRELTPSQQAAVLELGIPGFEFVNENKRFYPAGRAAAHLVGHVDLDNKGIAGFERFIDRHFLSDMQAVGFSKDTEFEPMPLSIDMRVQHVLNDELSNALELYQAKAAVGVLMDAKTGEVMAMSSLPDFDPNNAKDTLGADTLNRATAGVFEVGSIFKALTIAMALDTGRVSLQDKFDATEPLRIGKYKIRDFHAKRRVLSVPEVFIYSSNIGTAKMAQVAGVEGHHQFLDKLGLLQKAHHELPEVGKPILPRKWTELTSATISFGHGVSVTPLQTIAAMTAMVNGGKLIHPTFRPRTEAEAEAHSVQVISPQTSAKMRYLFRLNVEKGSGRRAEVEGYWVGGKTGTAEKVVNGRYSGDKKLNSFISAFPINDPRYVLLVMIDEPQPLEGQRSATAGLNAAPTTAAIIDRIATTLGVAPKIHKEGTPIPLARIR